MTKEEYFLKRKQEVIDLIQNKLDTAKGLKEDERATVVRLLQIAERYSYETRLSDKGCLSYFLRDSYYSLTDPIIDPIIVFDENIK